MGALMLILLVVVVAVSWWSFGRVITTFERRKSHPSQRPD